MPPFVTVSFPYPVQLKKSEHRVPPSITRFPLETLTGLLRVTYSTASVSLPSQPNTRAIPVTAIPMYPLGRATPLKTAPFATVNWARLMLTFPSPVLNVPELTLSVRLPPPPIVLTLSYQFGVATFAWSDVRSPLTLNVSGEMSVLLRNR